MRSPARLAPLVLAALLPGAAHAAPQTYLATGGAATFEHRVLLVNVLGKIEGVSSEVKLDVSDLGTASGSVTVPVAGLKTGIALRDSHAKGENALNAARYPNATFTLSKLPGGRLVPGQTLATTATGVLTVKGVAKAASIPVKATLTGQTVTVSTQFKFDPHEFGVNYPGSSNSVTVNVNFILTPR